ncbi:dipeptidase AC. Metallo peptidase. MEROPS family M19 [Loktanella atrilutea]|uniref:Dipeptidase AC. Metallo peptidase. MEROPS family M19 n=1 Tax=Loktanella atrilutea TaxID=366533 RepID=A0A1M4WYE8_LOKAT|nr:dipeptidase [Loktanella atrilutea]SHE86259.1 dipeptidase AC. Metallo peptidase. MEROPS family M19 [Loktanella atrilutea]
MTDTPTDMPMIFDGHNDFLLRLLRDPVNRETTWLTDTGHGHLDLPRMQRGGFGGGFFAIYISSPDQPYDIDDMMANPPYSVPLPPLIDHVTAMPVALAMAGHLKWMERASEGAFRICRTVAELRDCQAKGIVSAIMHIEGAEPISADLDALYLWHDMGLRSIGPVWSRPTVFGHGVPFAFPSSPDTGDGLTAAGKDLVRLCNDLGIMLDLSHLNEAGFNDVATLSDAPLVATHSNAHAITPSARNLTDRQLDMIRDTGGMVGLNYATGFLNEDGAKADDRGWDPMLRHLDYLIGRLGEDHVGFGSDFDGAQVPAIMGDVAGLNGLRAALRAHGYGAELMTKLCHENWFAVLDRTWKP